MITGSCPYCDAGVVNYMPENTPKFGKSVCEECGEQYWMYYSRVESIAYTKEGFDKKFIVDEESKSIVPTEEHQQHIDESRKFWDSDYGKFLTKKVCDDIVNEMLYGTSDKDAIKKGIEDGIFIKPPELTEEQDTFLEKIFPSDNKK